MISMKINSKEAYSLVSSEEAKSPDLPKYPYGLKICLDDESLKKLGFDSLPKVGSEMMILAKVEVCSARTYETMAGGSDNGVDLQITDMEIRSDEEKSIESSFYGEK